MTRTRTAAVLMLLALTVGACGDNGDAVASSSISAMLLKQQKTSTNGQLFALTKKNADCIGSGMVDKVGRKKLMTYGLIDKNNKAKGNVGDLKMSATDAKATTGVFFSCADITTMIKKAIDKNASSLPAKAKTCIDSSLDEKTLRTAITYIFQGNQDQFQKSLTAPLTKCAGTTN